MVSPEVAKYKEHIGMAYWNCGMKLFCFQLLNDSDYAVASVSITNGCLENVMLIESLIEHDDEIIAMAQAKHDECYAAHLKAIDDAIESGDKIPSGYSGSKSHEFKKG